jgi:lipopolysaccharide export system permease protein
VATFIISVFLMLMQFMWKYIGDLVGKGLEWYIIFEFVFYSIPYLIPRALPLAVLLSSIMTFGNLGERYELVAMKSSGVSLLRAMRPMLAVMTVIAGLAFYSTNVLIPKANLSWGALFYDVTNKKPAMNIQDGIFFKDLQGYAIRVGHKHKDNQTLDDVLIYAKTDNTGLTSVILAKRGKMEFTDNERFLKLTLYDGKRYQEMTNSPNYNKTFPANTMEFSKYHMAIDLTELELKRSSPELFKDNYEMLNLKELQVRIDSLDIILAEKYKFLYGYLEAYFHIPNDSNKKSYQLDRFEVGMPYLLLLAQSYDSINVGFKDTIPKIASIDTAKKERSTITLNKSIKGFKNVAIDTGLDNNERIAQRKRELESLRTNANDFEMDNTKLVTTAALVDGARQSTRNLTRIVESTQKDVASIKERQRRFDLMWHKKFNLAFSCILLFFIGAPMGAIIRKGGFGTPVIAAILMFIVYFILQTVGEKLGREGVLTTWVAAYFSSLLFVPLAAFLTVKASRDSALFDIEAYSRFFRRIESLFTKTKP